MSSVDVRLLPIFNDNYVFVITNHESKTCVVVDPGDAQPVQDFLVKQNLILEAILLTHHHDDHIGGVLELKEQWNVPTYAPLKNKTQIPFATDFVVEAQSLALLGGSFQLKVLELPGHTLGHVAFFEPHQKWLFSGDVLFGLGCGRLFEGTFEQAYVSLQRIKNLPHDTLVYCTHEYTEANLRFCRKVSSSPELDVYEKLLIEKRSAHQSSVPLHLSVEKATSPFLLAKDVAEFKQLRELRNRA